MLWNPKGTKRYTVGNLSLTQSPGTRFLTQGAVGVICYPEIFICIYMFFFLFFVFCFLGPHPRHMEVPRLEAELELQPLACATATETQDLSLVCNLHHSSQQWCQILNPLSEARDRTRNSRFLVRFVSAAPWQELPQYLLLQHMKISF